MNNSRAIIASVLFFAPKLFVLATGSHGQAIYILHSLASTAIAAVSGYNYRNLAKNLKKNEVEQLPKSNFGSYVAVKFVSGLALGWSIITNCNASDPYSESLYEGGFLVAAALNRGYWYGSVISMDVAVGYAIGQALAASKSLNYNTLKHNLLEHVNAMSILSTLGIGVGFAVKNYIWHLPGTSDILHNVVTSTIACYIVNELVGLLIGCAVDKKADFPDGFELYSRLIQRTLLATFNGFGYTALSGVTSMLANSNVVYPVELAGAMMIESSEEAIDAAIVNTDLVRSATSKLLLKNTIEQTKEKSL